MMKSLIVFMLLFCLSAAQEPASLEVDSKCVETNVKPNPAIGKYYVYANTTKPCLVAHVSSYLSLGEGHYLTLDNGTVNTNNTNITLGVSRCGSVTEDPQLVILFNCGHALRFTVKHSNDTKSVKIGHIDGYFKNNNQTVLFSNSTENFITTQTGHYYKCNAEQSVGLDTVPKVTPASLVLSNFAYEAYRDVSGTDFYGVPEECSFDAQPVSDLVRVAVGICLIALVAIVLVAYFIGRRRWSERSSYESV